MGTSVFYNGLELRNVLTREFEQTPVREETGTDVIHTKFTIHVQSLVNSELLSAAVANLGVLRDTASISSSDMPTVLATAAKLLCQDRKPFRYVMDGVVLVDSGGTLDANNGPKTFGVKLTQISSNTVRISFGVEVCLVQCDSAQPVVNNRWSMAEDIDSSFCTTRRWKGKLRVATSILNPQAFRGLCIPVLHRGWKRENMSFVGESNSLELTYEITDRQMLGDAPPPGIVRMSGTHSESLLWQGSKGVGNISVRLDGFPGQDKRYMIERGTQIIYNKLAIQAANTKWLKQVTFTDYFGDDVNSVEVSANIERVQNAGGSENTTAKIGAMSLASFGLPMRSLNLADYQDGVSYVQGPYATATLAGLFACYLQNPCDSNRGMPQLTESTPDRKEADKADDQEQPQANVAEGTVPADFTNPVEYSEAHEEAMYVHAKIDSGYDVRQNRVGLPIAYSSDDGEDVSTISVIKLGRTTAMRRISCEFERMDKPPQLWNPTDFDDANGITHSLKHFKPILQPPTTTGDGRTLYSVDAEYVFWLSRPPRSSEKYSMGTLPWDKTTKDENVYEVDNFVEPDSDKGI